MNGTPNNTCATYVRVSGDDQLKDGNSIPEQQKTLRDWARSEGLTIVAEYQDDISGTTEVGRRPAGSQMMEHAAASKFSTILVTKVDRWSRSLIAGATDLRRLTDSVKDGGLDVQVNFKQIGNGIKGGLDTSTGMGKIMLQLLLMFAEWEREQIRERTLMGNKAAAEAGRITPGRLPYGITSDDAGQLVIVNDEAEAVAQMFTLRAQGLSYPQILRKMMATNHRPRPSTDMEATRLTLKENPNADPVMTRPVWQVGSITKIIQQTGYMGTYSRKLDGTVYTYDVPEIVSPDLWQRANAIILKSNVKDRGKRKHVYVLGGNRLTHLHSDGTTSSMYGRQQGKSLIYRCTAATKKADGTLASCSGFGVHGSTVTTKVNCAPIDGLALLWMIDKLSDADEWEKYVIHADESLIEEGLGADDVETHAATVKRLKAKRMFVRSQAADVAADDGAEAAKEWLALSLAPIEAQLEGAEGALERAQDAQSWRSRLSVGLADLLTMEVKWTEEGQKIQDAEWHQMWEENTARNTEGWIEALRAEAHAATEPDKYGNTKPLSKWATAEAKRLVHLLSLSIQVSERTSPDGLPKKWEGQPLALLPNVEVSFSPATVLHHSSLSWARGDLNPHDLAITGT